MQMAVLVQRDISNPLCQNQFQQRRIDNRVAAVFFMNRERRLQSFEEASTFWRCIFLCRMNVACKRSRQQECSHEGAALFASDSKPLKRFGGLSSHGYDFELVKCNCGEVAGESFDPLRIVMTHSDAFI